LKLRRAYAIDSGASVQFQLEKEIEQVEADLAKIGQQQEDLERLSGDGRLYQALLKLGYRQQVQTFRKFVQGYPVSAFLIHGGMEYGQRWLLNRLVVQHTQDSIAGKVIKINLTRVARKSDVAALWRELSNRVGLGRQGTIAEIANRVYQWWQTQHVLLIFYEVDALSEAFLAQFLAEFWQPLVSRELAAVESPYRLLMFLVDYDGCVGDWPMAFVETQAANWTSMLPVKLAKIAEFSEGELGNWLEVFSGDLPLGLLEDAEDTVQTILDNSDQGIPEPAMSEICRMAGSDWYENEDRWLKL
jgi:inactive STAND